MKKIVNAIFIAISCFMFLFVLEGKDKVRAYNEVSWGYSATNMDDFVTKTQKFNKEEVVVAVIDSGIDASHEWVKNRVIGGAYCNNDKCETGKYNDESGHGTSVAGIIAKATPDNVKILPIKREVVRVTDTGEKVYSSKSAIQSLWYIRDLVKSKHMNIKVVNFSMSTIGTCSDNSLYSSIIKELYSLGVLVVSAAGNNNANADSSCMNTVDETIVVSAINSDMKRDVGSADSIHAVAYGVDEYSNFGTVVDFAAPGTLIRSANLNGGTSLVTGTSYAAPHVSADIALIYSICKDYSVSKVESILISSAKHPTATQKDEFYGYGYIDMAEVYQRIMSRKVTITTQGFGFVQYENTKNDGTSSVINIRSAPFQPTTDLLTLNENLSLNIEPSILHKVKYIKVNGEIVKTGKLFQTLEYAIQASPDLSEELVIEIKFSFLF